MKVGDKVWVRAMAESDAYNDGTLVAIRSRPFDGNNEQRTVLTKDVLPHHDALPAVARWLAEHDDARRDLAHVLDVYDGRADAKPRALDTLNALVLALTEGQG